MYGIRKGGICTDGLDKRFAREFAKDLRAEQALRRAGYDGKRAGAAADRMLENDDVIAEIDVQLAARLGGALDGERRVMEEVRRLAFDDAEAKQSDKLRALEQYLRLIDKFRTDAGEDTAVCVASPPLIIRCDWGEEEGD